MMGLKIGLLGVVGAALMLSGCVTESDQPLVVPQTDSEKATIAGKRHYGAPLDIPVLTNRAKNAKAVPNEGAKPGDTGGSSPPSQ